jgi:hypothetical protein
MKPADILGAIGSLQAAGVPLPGPSECATSGNGLVGKRPEWMNRFGLLREEGNAWFYCAPNPNAEPGCSGQLLLQFPPGRYLVDTFDVHLKCAMARESAAGDPLVIGLPFSKNPLLLWIRRLPDANLL